MMTKEEKELRNKVVIFFVISFLVIGGFIFGIYKIHQISKQYWLEHPINCNSPEYQLENKEIYSLNIDKSLSGSFFIGIGRFNQNVRYYFFKQDGNGVVLDSVNAEYTRLIESDNVKPHYVSYGFNSPSECNNRDSIYVPVGTIKVSYDVNIKG